MILPRSAVRIVATALATLAVAAFVQLYGALQANWLQHAHKLSLAVLPLPTAFYHRYALAGYVLPVAALLLLLLRDREAKGRAPRFEILLRLVGLAALVWALGAVLAWQLPLYVPDAPVK
ncbi:MAG TPA: hypothetical protein VLT83_00780 [Opitutaceae bacterium]|nr:hypothetical protein [Opitutaceae bacterium]